MTNERELSAQVNAAYRELYPKSHASKPEHRLAGMETEIHASRKRIEGLFVVVEEILADFQQLERMLAGGEDREQIQAVAKHTLHVFREYLPGPRIIPAQHQGGQNDAE